MQLFLGEVQDSDRAVLWILLPVVAAIIAHGPGLSGGFTNWDDPTFLLHNPLTQAPLSQGWLALLTTPEIGYAIPVTTLGYAGQRVLFELDPMGFHIISLILHLGVTVLCYALIRRFEVRPMAAALAAAVFAVHPVTVEPVAWVVGQKDLWATAFVLAALWIRAGTYGSRIWATVLCALLAGLAMGAKPSAVATPVLLLAVDVVRHRRLLAPRNAGLYAITGVLALLVTWAAVSGHSDIEQPVHMGGGTLAQAGWALALQLSHLVAPVSLSARYFPPAGSSLLMMAGLGVVLGLIWLVLVAVAWRRGHQLVAFSLAAALFAYAPVSGIVGISRGPADSYLYLPMALLMIAVGSGLGRLAGRGRLGGVAVALAMLAVMALVALSQQRGPVWRDSRALWTDARAAYPDQPVANLRVANARMYEGDLVGALVVLDDVVRRWPTFAAGQLDRGVVLDSLGEQERVAGLRAMKERRQKEVDAHFERAQRYYRDAESALATAARLDRLHGEVYALFLIRRPELFPSDEEVATRVLVDLAPVLAKRGKRPNSLERAAALLEHFGHHGLANDLRLRVRELEEREAQGAAMSPLR